MKNYLWISELYIALIDIQKEDLNTENASVLNDPLQYMKNLDEKNSLSKYKVSGLKLFLSHFDLYKIKLPEKQSIELTLSIKILEDVVQANDITCLRVSECIDNGFINYITGINEQSFIATIAIIAEKILTPQKFN
jgi:hypothetical protein